jgi:hypothetical protein
MSIPEPSAVRPHTLYTSGPDGKLKPASKEQRAAELSAVYGDPMSTQVLNLSAGEIERMRQIVSQADSQNKNGIAPMDLNNPPKEPYRYQKFPMMVYNHGKSVAAHDEVKGVKVGNVITNETVHVPAKLVSTIVNNEKELEKALKAGWKAEPPEFLTLNPLSIDETEEQK